MSVTVSERLLEWRRLARRFAGYLWFRIDRDKCLFSAATLSYTSLLALVPLLAVAFSVIAIFPLMDEWSSAIRDFVFTNYVPAANDSIQGNIQTAIDEFMLGARQLPAGSVAFLILTALLLMQEIEATMNRLFRVREERAMSGRFMVYWAMMSLGPLLVGASLAMSSSLLAALSTGGIDTSAVSGFLLSVLPFMVQLMAFLLLFWVVPNRRVPFRAAFVGALFSAILFELAKVGFVWYVTTFPTYQKIYGAMAVFPIFLLWIYVSWIVILLGAILASGFTGLEFSRIQYEVRADQRFAALIRLCHHLWQTQRRGTGLTESELMALEPTMAEDLIVDLLDNLRLADLVRRSEAGRWLLVRDPDEVTLLDLYECGDFVLPVGPIAVGDAPWAAVLKDRLGQCSDQCRDQLGVSLKTLYSSGDASDR